MLKLTHRAGATIKIGDDITLHVLEVRGVDVYLGYEAPPSIPILRGEAKKSKPSKPHAAPAITYKKKYTLKDL